MAAQARIRELEAKLATAEAELARERERSKRKGHHALAVGLRVLRQERRIRRELNIRYKIDSLSLWVRRRL